MKEASLILLLSAAIAWAAEPQFVFENRPDAGLPRDAEAQQQSGRPETNTTFNVLLSNSVVMVQVRYFSLTWLDQGQVQEYVSGLLADPAIRAGSRYYWSQSLGEPELECYLTLQHSRQCKLLVWETVGSFQDADGTWWFLDLSDYFHRAHPHGDQSPAARYAQFAKRAITNLPAGSSPPAPVSVGNHVVSFTEYQNSITAYLNNIVRVDCFASADLAKLGLARSIMRPMNYTDTETIEGGQFYRWNSNALAGAVGPYVLDVTARPATSVQMTNGLLALIRELKARTEDPGPDKAEAVRFALKSLVDAGRDTSQHEMAEPESVQRLANEKAWRVSWRPKTPAGTPAIKGGQIVVLVHDSGRIEFGFGE